MHAPGPHSVSTGVVGSAAADLAVRRTLDRAVANGCDVTS
jgi:hypothetical protein